MLVVIGGWCWLREDLEAGGLDCWCFEEFVVGSAWVVR